MDLVVLDAYAIICTGGYLRDNSKSFQRMPTTGLSYFFGYLARELADCKDVVVCFDFKGDKHFGNSRERRTELAGYKSNRTIDNSVLAQCKLAYELCEMTGVKCFKTPVMEADSAIYNIVNLCRMSGKYMTIEVHSGDYDLAHNVLYDAATRTNVTFVAVNANVNDLSQINFSTGIYPGVRIPPNTISAYKTLTFDKSDRIKAFPGGKQLYESFTALLQKGAQAGYENFLDPLQNRSKEFFLVWAKSLVGSRLTEEEYRLLERRADTVFPKEFADYPALAEITADMFIGCNCATIKRRIFASVLRATGSPVRPAEFKRELTGSIEEEIVTVFRQAANDLLSGKFSAVTPRPLTPTEFRCGDLDLDRGMIE